jgi:hypothetical protein
VPDSPLVSVCIPTYQNARHVTACIESALAQTYEPLEILVVDDSSSDDSHAIAQRYAQTDRRLRCWRNESNLGLGGNWNRCLERARGRYVMLFHGDDVYASTVVERLVGSLQANPRLGAAFTLATWIDAGDRVLRPMHVPPGVAHAGELDYFQVLYETLRYRNFLVCPSAMLPRAIWLELGGFAPDRCFSVDLDMWLRLLQRHPVTVLPQRLVRCRLSATHTTYRFHCQRTELDESFPLLDQHLKTAMPGLCQRYSAAQIDQARYMHVYWRLKDLAFCHANAILLGQRPQAAALAEQFHRLRRAVPPDYRPTFGPFDTVPVLIRLRRAAKRRLRAVVDQLSRQGLVVYRTRRGLRLMRAE